VTAALALLTLGVLLGFGAAFLVRALRDGRRGAAFVVALLLAPIVAYLVWLAFMLFGVGPAMR